jgi:hypothetical protein
MEDSEVLRSHDVRHGQSVECAIYNETILRSPTSKRMARSVLMASRLLRLSALWVLFFAPASFAQMSPVHVAVSVRRPDGQSVRFFSAKSLSAELNGNPVSIRTVRPQLGNRLTGKRYIPTRVLAVFASPVRLTRPSIQPLLDSLQPAWRRGWQVAMERTDGCVTGYANSGAELRNLLLVPIPNKIALPPLAAIQQLKSFQGRAVVFYLAPTAPNSAEPPGDLVAAAMASDAELLIVDGGAPRNGSQFEVGPGSSGPGGGGGFEGVDIAGNMDRLTGGPSMVVEESGRQEQFSEGRYHEVTLRNAVRRAVEDASIYYDLRLDIPLSYVMQTSSGIGDSVVTVRIHASPPLLVAARIYGTGVIPRLKVVEQ